jgi:hypothetical protein
MSSAPVEDKYPPTVVLFPWLDRLLAGAGLLQRAFYGLAGSPILSARDVDRARQEGRDADLGHFVDLRHGTVRYTVLRELEAVGHPCAWALGLPWTPLSDEQAGRLAAEMIRRLGPGVEVPKVPREPLPVAVLGPAWYDDSKAEERRTSLAAVKVVRVAFTPGRVTVVGSAGQNFVPAWDEQGRPVWRSSSTVILVEDLTPIFPSHRRATP